MAITDERKQQLIQMAQQIKSGQMQLPTEAPSQGILPKAMTGLSNFAQGALRVGLGQNPEVDPSATNRMNNAYTMALMRSNIAETTKQNDPEYQARLKSTQAGTAEKENPLGFSDKDRQILTNVNNVQEGYDPKSIIDQLDPGTKDVLRGIGEYDVDLKSIRGMKAGPMTYGLIKAVKAVYPDWDEKEYDARQQFLKSWKGKTDTNPIIAIKQTTRHLGELKPSVDSLMSSGSPAVNKPWQWVQKNMSGDPRVTDVQTNLTAVTEELTKAWAGSNNGLERVKEWEKSLQLANSPQQWNAAISKAAKLLKDATRARTSFYKSAMGREAPSILDPEEQSIMDNLSGLYSAGGQANGQVASSGFKVVAQRPIGSQ
jgi:hypothetical protein